MVGALNTIDSIKRFVRLDIVISEDKTFRAWGVVWFIEESVDAPDIFRSMEIVFSPFSFEIHVEDIVVRPDGIVALYLDAGFLEILFNSLNLGCS